MTEATIGNLGDIPDLTGITGTTTEPFEDGWYAGTILAKREFTDQNGNDRIFESLDDASQKGDSRNIRLQVELKRKSDGRTLNVSTLVNYRMEDLTPEVIQAVIAGTHDDKRAGIALARLSALQRIAGVRQLQRNGHGGLDITPLFGKTAYFRIGEDSRNAQYKEIKAFQEKAPKKVL